MQIEVQACGCISLPVDLSRALQLGPGAVLEVTQIAPDAFRVVRVRAAEADVAERVACPTPL